MGMLLNPLTLFWILLALSAICYKLKRKKTCRILAIVAVAELFLFSVTPLPIWMMRNLEGQYSIYNPNTLQRYPILVLGGGHTNDPDLLPHQRLSHVALARLTEGMRHYRLTPGSKLILSGYSQSGQTSMAETMALAAVSFGISPKDTLMMTEPATTWDEAQEYKKRFGTSGEFLLVTSASHMPRAMETFKCAGLKPIPVPAEFVIKHDPQKYLYNWKPSANKLLYSQIALHEYFGIWYYRWFKE
ncbi:YdcF family protein [Flavobacterium sp. MFBS3-15]|uniref:ElyC/SanA/YdcF family protein n=1 Tax=Flavobacterium sp. MFBS3-15 TaxID=2989816 RepID=UPI002236BF2E|nr:ElyC/SanA/YdcF family protein [Flavobacterium sp. MFBS3-15]MCW4469943.1 YdcF family protein [Flavobacterium sp. MFBS3-15]